MAWLEKLKLNKQLVRTITEAGYTAPKEVQLKTLSRIIGGQDVIVVGPEGCGKTTTYILAVLNKIRHTAEGVPIVLILVPDKDRVLDVISRFEKFNKNSSIRIVGLFAAPGIEAQMDDLAEGADIVVATPDRARAIYLKLGLNLNKMELLILDDAELIVKQGLQLPVAELANSITKCQHLVFTEVVHDKLNRMIEPFMKLPATVEIEESGEAELTLYPQMLYHVPNFGTKLNLLHLFMEDDEVFTKTVVFVNTNQTAEKLYKDLQNRLKLAVALLQPVRTGQNALSIEAFKVSAEVRVLIIANENEQTVDLDSIPFLLHFDLPESKETYIDRLISDTTDEEEDETIALTFATDLELSMVKKIEQATGKKMPLIDLPDGLVIAKDRKDEEVTEKKASKHKETTPVAGEAFHEKKASNAKTYNYGGGQKAKMNNKRNHS